MSLDEIKLPDFIIAELYKNSLVELENLQVEKTEKKYLLLEEPVKELIEKQEIKYLGQNKKHIAVVVDEPKSLFINEAELDFLTKILTACNLNLADIAIVNHRSTPLTYQHLLNELKAQYILLLGVAPASIKLPFTIPVFQVQNFAEAVIFHTPSLSKMLLNNQDSRLMKSKLWLSLKTAFKL